jgi:hypothetical protein
MSDSEYFDQLKDILVLWVKIKDERYFGRIASPDDFYTPFSLGFDTKEWEEGMEESRRKIGKSREEFLTHLRVLMLFN